MDSLKKIIGEKDLKEVPNLSHKQSEKLVMAIYNVITSKEKESYKDNDADKYYVFCHTDGISQGSNTAKRTFIIGTNVFLDPYKAYQFAMNFEKRHPEAKGNSEISELNAKEYCLFVALVEILKAVIYFQED